MRCCPCWFCIRSSQGTDCRQQDSLSSYWFIPVGGRGSFARCSAELRDRGLKIQGTKMGKDTGTTVKLSKTQRWKLQRAGQAEHVRKMREEAIKKAEQDRLARLGPPKSSHTPSKQEKNDFYKSWEWRSARVKVLQRFSASCQLCGASSKHLDMTGEPVRVVVDHIYPLHTHWDMRLDASNLQVLCDECNQGKGAWNTSDFRYSDAELPASLTDQLRPRY